MSSLQPARQPPNRRELVEDLHIRHQLAVRQRRPRRRREHRLVRAVLVKPVLQRRALDRAALDRAAKNVLIQKFATCLFDRPFVPTSDRALAQMRSTAHRQLAADVVRGGAVLLQNEGAALPLRGLGAESVVAVLGPLAGCADGGASGARCDFFHVIW